MIASSLLCIFWFALLILPGFVIVRGMVRQEKHLLVLLPLSVFVGTSTFLFALNWLLYLLPFAWANKLGLLVYAVFFVGVGLKYNLLTWHDVSWNLSAGEKRVFLIVASIIAVMFTALTAGTFYGDNIFHSTQAISIQHGNIHPLKWPWYPDYHYAYHYAYALMKASVQDFCGINQFYSDKPWMVVMIVCLFSFIVGFVTRNLQGNFKAGLGAGIFFLFFCGFSTIPMLNTVVHLVADATHQPVKTTYEALINLYKGPPYLDISFFPHSIHKPMLMRFPVYVVLVFLFVQGPKRGRLDAPFILINTGLLGFLCLCDESLFGLTGLGLGTYVLAKTFWTENGHRLHFFGHGMAVLVLGGLCGILEGGFLTTVVFHRAEQFAPGSEFGGSGGHGRLSLREGFRFVSHPILTLNAETWLFFGRYYVLPMICFVALQVHTWRNRKRLTSDWTDAYLVWCITFWIGVIFAGIFTVIPSDTVLAARMYVWPIMCLSAGASLMLWLDARLQRSGSQKLVHWLMGLVILFCITGTLLRIGTGCAMSAAYFVSNERKEVRKNLVFGEWLRHTLPRDAVTFGIDARYTGLFSFAGNPFMDGAAIPRSDLDALERAKTTVDYDFLRRNKVTHLVVDGAQYAANHYVLSNGNRFREVGGPYAAIYRVFQVLP